MLFSDEDRRLRVVSRQHLGRTAGGPSDVVKAVAALHSSDPLTPFLACWARVPDFTNRDLETALYVDRKFLRMHTIRRTLFVVPMEDAPVFEAGATRAIARRERARLVGWLGDVMEPSKVNGWLDRVTDKVMSALSGRELSTKALSGEIPDLAQTVTVGSGRWLATVPVSSRLLYLMAMDGMVVRGRPAGTWRSSQYSWARTRDWLGAEMPRLDEETGRAELARRYLATHGPVTMTDLRWWTGWTLGAVRAALSHVDVEEVELDSGEPALVLRGDTKADEEGAGAVSLMPSLDSTIMGWKDRNWYLGHHGPQLFDTAGNAGPTVWASGRVVGGWGQNPDGTVVHDLLGDVDSAIRESIDAESEALTKWLQGVVVMPRFPSPVGLRLAGKGVS